MQLQQPFAISHGGLSGFGYYSPITVDHTQIPSTQTDFPVLFIGQDNRLRTVANGGHVQNSSGFDIRPYSDAGLSSALTYERVTYDATVGLIEIWVKIASLSSSVDTVIYLAYGNASLSTDGSSTATWSNSFNGVYHLKDGTTLTRTDSTSNANNLNNNNSVTATVGQIDGGANFVAASSQSLEDGGALGSLAAKTWSAWIKAPTLPGAYNTVFGRGFGGSTYDWLAVKSTGKLVCYVKASANLSYDGTGSHTLSTNTWYYLALSYNSSAGLIGYVNAVSDGTVAANGNANATSVSTYVGGDRANSSSYWDGVIDEARCSSVARSADWITTEYNNQSLQGSGFYTMGTEVPL